MKTLKFFILLFLTAGMANAQSSENAQIALTDTFKNVLDLAHMSFTIPKDAIPVPVVKNKQMHYEYAITFKDQPFEVRYAVSPMGYSVAEAYTGGKGITPRPIGATANDEMAKAIAFVVATNVGGGIGDPNIKTGYFPAESVKKEFNADWGGTTLVELKNNSFGTDYKYCIMTTLHKNDLASAYVFYLSDTKENLMKLLTNLIAKTGAFYALKFK
ncbi:hypothetical protein [Pedobacter heparinus]|uniref:hypothetical protein n=1 Tax=Pedobacter heparinus TaxID=984 RepID=UPI002931C67E|nr:hypothetical protein [Pedobacter heparinus]